MHQALPVEALGESGPPEYRSFYQQLRRLGWVEGRTIAIERWFFDNQIDRFAGLAREVVGTIPDIIVTNGGVIVQHFQAATKTIPIVAAMSDPVSRGLVPSLARPGGNLTGVTYDGGIEQYGKQVQFIVEVAPKISRIGYIAAPRNSTGSEPPQTITTRDAAARVNRTLIVVTLEGAVDAVWYREAFETLKSQGAETLIVAEASVNVAHARLIAELATANGWPSISPYAFAADQGMLMSYGADLVAQYARMAGYVDRILKGAKPADLPIQQTDRFRFAVNLKTVSALGLALPALLVSRADEVIE